MTNTGIRSAIKMAKSETGARSDPKDPECLVLSPTVNGTFRLSSLQLLIYFYLGLILILVRERQDVFTFYINKASQLSPRRPNQPRSSLRVRPGGCLSPGKAEGTAGERQEPRERPLAETTALLCKTSSAPSLWGLPPTPESCFSGRPLHSPKGQKTYNVPSTTQGSMAPALPQEHP